MRKYEKRIKCQRKIEKIGEEEWMKIASDEELSIWIEYKQKKQYNKI